MADETEKIVAQGLLYDFYGSLLTAHQQKIYELAVYNDFSLSEIAEAEQVSKQAVHDLLRRTTAILESYEERLHMIRRFQKIEALCGEAERAAAQDGAAPDAARQMYLTSIQRIREELTDGI
ncbi:YlxM family DNA-binding protein [Lachnoclostridium sp. Marseille-P6806]|uniref:YlxM family DNA-binding protein n=1 Tax=Lachnoclostridium sp. Marseille-P6806 TaxID=2364793 RepID=UPI00102F5931|nr:DNA-binding protein [Lachnoclostridium sp. Marseille-P6806]